MHRQLSTRAALALAVAGLVTFHVACLIEPAGIVTVGYLLCLYALAWAKSARWAFYLGLLIGTLVAAPQLWFFESIFGPAAVGLWAILGVWTGLFLLFSQIAVTRFPISGRWMIPVFWLAIEYFRSELYPLRFAWLPPGTMLSDPMWINLTACGAYGFSFLVLLSIAAVDAAIVTKPLAHRFIAVVPLAVLLGVAFFDGPVSTSQGPRIVGIQLEGPTASQVVEALERARTDLPETELFVLSEYTFDDVPPPEVLSWCREHACHLIAGGKELIAGTSTFRNTAFVVSPEGQIVFRQAKSVPVQFMNDGLPAESQALWNSPWGPIGIGICYDLSYSRVVDRLIELGAQALIIPTMDAEDWGGHEHWLHAKIAPVRAREYGVPIFRLASSGISQFVDAEGKVVTRAPFPGQGERIAGQLAMAKSGRRPSDRYVAILSVAVTCGFLVLLASGRVRRSPRGFNAQGSGNDPKSNRS